MKINELEDLLGVAGSTIKYYEDQGFVTPARTENGYRDYSDEEVHLLQRIIVLRKLGVGIPEVRNLIGDKADLHDILKQNMEMLRKQQGKSASAIEICEELDAEATDFAGIDSSKYLKRIYEAEQKGEQFADTSEISFRQLNLAITMLGMLAGVPVLQNKQFSEHSHDPIPDDIRGNKKDGDEYDTIGDVLSKGGKRKAVLIVVIVLFLALPIGNGLIVWGGFGGVGKYIFDFNRSGITLVEQDEEELARIAEIDPEAVSAGEAFELLRFHTKGDLLLTLKRSEGGTWTELERKVINADKGYMFVTGDPSSEIEIHIISDGKREKYRFKIGDSSYREEDTELLVNADQAPLNTEQAVLVFTRDVDIWSEVNDYVMNKDILKKVPFDGCYAITAQEAEKKTE